MNRIKRLGIFVEHFPPFLGSDRSTFELAKRVADTGVQVHFIVTQPLRYLIGERPPDWKYQNYWSGPPPKVHENISAEYLLVGKRMSTLWRRFMPLAYFLTIILFIIMSIKALIRFKPDVVIAAHASPIVGVTAVVSSKLIGKPFLMGCPDWMSAYAAGLGNESMASLKPVIIQLFEFTLYRWSNRIFAATEFLKNLLVSHGLDQGKIVVIPNGADVDLFSPDLDVTELKRKYRLDNRFVILFIGHLEDWAGVDLIYELANCLNQKVSDASILLVGAGESTRDLLSRLARANLGHMVTHAGLHPYNQMPLFTAASDVTLCLFPDTPVSHAASPLKLFEYLSSGTAVIATNVAGTTEVVDNTNAMLVAPGNTNEICDAVVTLRNDATLRKSLGERGRMLVEEDYSWSKLAQRLIEICESFTSNQ